MTTLFVSASVEFVGTFIFLLVILISGTPWIIGATLAILIYLGIDVSGAHYNPAVTLMTLYNKDIVSSTAGAYIIAQILGGILAAFIYKYTKGKA
jgi:glycerol uptake facilitator-like aquaporin